MPLDVFFVGNDGKGGEGSVIDERARPLDGDRVDRRVPAVLPIRIDLHRVDREHQRTVALPGAAVEEAVFDNRLAVGRERGRPGLYVA